jgi:hypothetical protein
MLEIERAQRRSGAQARLEEMRVALGLAAPVIDVASVERRELEP